MPTTYKILAQAAPAPLTPSTIYTVGANIQAVISSLIVCNRGTTEATFRISIAPAGASVTNSQYIYYDVPIPGNDTFIATIGITIAATDLVRVYSGGIGAGNVTFQLYGAEITP